MYVYNFYACQSRVEYGHVSHLTCHHPDSFFTVTFTIAPSGTDISSSKSSSWSSVTTKFSAED